MISLTRLSGSQFTLNATLIECIESTPDTVVRMTSGRTFVVSEPANVVIQRVTDYFRSIGIVGAGAAVKVPDEEEQK